MNSKSRCTDFRAPPSLSAGGLSPASPLSCIKSPSPCLLTGPLTGPLRNTWQIQLIICFIMCYFCTGRVYWERTIDLKEMFGVLKNHLSIFPPGNHKRVLYVWNRRAPLSLSYFLGVCVEEAESSLVISFRFLPTLLFPSGAPYFQGCQLLQATPPLSRIQRWSSETGSPCSVTPTPHDIQRMESNIWSKSR